MITKTAYLISNKSYEDKATTSFQTRTNSWGRTALIPIEKNLF
jgi:hypothetical protein